MAAGGPLAGEELAERRILVLDALDFLLKKKKKRLKTRTSEVEAMEKHIEELASDAWKMQKFFPYRTSLDWNYKNKVVVFCAESLEFPPPGNHEEGSNEEHEPDWWKGFRKYINAAISNKRGHCIDEIKKKMSRK